MLRMLLSVYLCFENCYQNTTKPVVVESRIVCLVHRFYKIDFVLMLNQQSQCTGDKCTESSF